MLRCRLKTGLANGLGGMEGPEDLTAAIPAETSGKSHLEVDPGRPLLGVEKTDGKGEGESSEGAVIMEERRRKIRA